MPSSTIVLLSGVDESSSGSVCKFQWFLAACSLLVSVLTLSVSKILEHLNYKLINSILIANLDYSIKIIDFCSPFHFCLSLNSFKINYAIGI